LAFINFRENIGHFDLDASGKLAGPLSLVGVLATLVSLYGNPTLDAGLVTLVGNPRMGKRTLFRFRAAFIAVLTVLGP
jgi:hypothetical protein